MDHVTYDRLTDIRTLTDRAGNRHARNRGPRSPEKPPPKSPMAVRTPDAKMTERVREGSLGSSGRKDGKGACGKAFGKMAKPGGIVSGGSACTGAVGDANKDNGKTEQGKSLVKWQQR